MATFDKCLDKVLVLSTAHLRESSFNWVDRDMDDQFGHLAGLKWQYGWMIYTTNVIDADESWPAEFVHILKVAHCMGVDWVRFDCDAQCCDAFPIFEGEEIVEGTRQECL